MRSLVWFRSDLRSTDNTALFGATHAGRSDDGCVALFVISSEEWQRHDFAPVRVEFMLRNLAELSRSLAALNIPLQIVTADREKNVPLEVLKIATEHHCGSVHFNREYEIDEQARDTATTALLEADSISVHPYDDQTALAPGIVRTLEDRPFTVFTPFKKRWISTWLEQGGTPVLPAPTPQRTIPIQSSVVPSIVPGFVSQVDPSHWPAGEDSAKASLAEFTSQRLALYKSDRDFPAISGTSKASAYLASGVLSPRQCIAAAVAANRGAIDGPAPGPTHWISEIIWREFYVNVLCAFPRVCRHRAFKPATDRIRWSHDVALFDRWKTGTTGVPIVDAAMRQLNTTGWMHNRLRMVAAMYLSKDLFIDWRWGEKYFMQTLVDGFFASNNGGWQWSASTGTDAAPYFRIFNPVSQSRTYDPDGAFIRAYCPELKDLDNEAIHEPYSDKAGVPALMRSKLAYPEPVVDHRLARDRVIEAFKAIGTPVGG